MVVYGRADVQLDTLILSTRWSYGQLQTSTSLIGEKAPSTQYMCVDHRVGLMQRKAKKKKYLAPAKSQTSILGC
jgi:hypothetical protein